MRDKSRSVEVAVVEETSVEPFSVKTGFIQVKGFHQAAEAERGKKDRPRRVKTIAFFIYAQITPRMRIRQDIARKYIM
jgi:hypothetical protein